MPHRRKPRRTKADQQLIRLEQEKPANVIALDSDRVEWSDRGNLVPKLSEGDRLEIEETIRQRFDSAEETTNNIAKEINKSERQFKGLFPDWEEWADISDDDVRIFMKKTMEQVQVVYAHLDGLTGQLNPLLTMQPAVTGVYPPRMEFERAKVKELMVNYYLDKNKFKKDVLSRWRWNFLKHPSAYLRVTYEVDSMQPDIRFDVVDRGMLYLDPYITTGDVKDGAWIIERAVVTRDEAVRNIDMGYWHVEGDLSEVSNLFAPPQDDVVARLTSNNLQGADHRGPEQDDLVEVMHYWQAEKRGAPHAYGVVLGGRNGKLVRWGPNPYPYKGLPYRGKSYMRDVYKPDGVSLSMQYRHIQELYNTFFNLRIEDVLENVKQRFHVFSSLFDDKTKEDHENNQKYVRFADAFMQQIIDSNKSLSDFMLPPTGGDSTQHLLSDLQYIGQEGEGQISVGDTMRGQNPQTGATLGQVQEQLMQSLGVFRPIFTQEMTLIEEIGEIVNTYFADPDFFGPERIASIIGPNRYAKVIEGFQTDSRTGIAARAVYADEMDVDVTVEVLNQAEHLASRTLRLQQQDVFFESLRHHPELAAEAAKTINFSALYMRRLQDMGEDIEAITFTDEEKAQRAEEQEKQRHQEKMEIMQDAILLEDAKEEARAKREIQVANQKTAAEMASTENKLEAQHDFAVAEAVAKANAEHRTAMAEMLQDHKLTMERMFLEADLEIKAAKQGVTSSVQTGGNDVNTPSAASGKGEG